MQKCYVNVKVSFSKKSAKVEICEKENLNNVIFWGGIEKDLFLSFIKKDEFYFIMYENNKKNHDLINWKFLKINNFKLLDSFSNYLICSATIYF